MGDWKDLAIVGVLGVAGYFIYKKFAGNLTPTQAKDLLAKSGGEVYPSTLSPTYTNVKYGQTTYQFTPEELTHLNLAQQILLQMPFIPKAWVLE